MRLTFCGVRGSSPASGQEFSRIGGHTSCVTIGHSDLPPTLVLDCGSGIRAVTGQLGGAAFSGTVILGHVHWDHLMGLPFFSAADRPEARTRLLLPDQGPSAEDLLAQIMRPPFFPIGPGDLRGTWSFESYREGHIAAEGFDIVAREIPHKGGCTMGLRVSDGVHTVAYLSDHAPQVLGPGADGTGEFHEAALELADGVDVLIHDSQYTAAELPTRGAFGHAAAEHSVGLALRAGAKRVVLFHHDPGRTDDEVDAILAACRALPQPSRALSPLVVDAAAQGMIIDLS